MTNGDKIRESLRTNENLAAFLQATNADLAIDYCQNKRKCQEYLDTPGATVPECSCKNCLVKWLEKDHEDEKVSDSDTHWHESVMRTFLANH